MLLSHGKQYQMLLLESMGLYTMVLCYSSKESIHCLSVLSLCPNHYGMSVESLSYYPYLICTCVLEMICFGCLYQSNMYTRESYTYYYYITVTWTLFSLSFTNTELVQNKYHYKKILYQVYYVLFHVCSKVFMVLKIQLN